MKTSQIPSYVTAGAVIAMVLAALGVPLTALIPFAVLLACPLMMILMMRGMGGMHGQGEDHSGHGCEHDPTRSAGSSSHRV